jgi:uncharacterized membrane protein (UPF0127 family)
MVKNRTTNEIILTRLKWCKSFGTRLRGLTFRRTLPPGAGILLDEGRESSVATAIHMMFVFFPIAAVWLDAQFCVVDKVLARPFRLYYASRKPARYILEAAPALLEKVALGDQLEIEGS